MNESITMEAAATRRDVEVELPIGCRDDEGRVHRTVILRKMTGKEEALLAEREKQRNGGRLVTELLHSCLNKIGDLPKPSPSAIAGMYSADRNYLLLKLRVLTFGNELEASYNCPSCSEKTHILEDLDSL